MNETGNRTRDTGLPDAPPLFRLRLLGGLALTALDGRGIELPTRKSALLLAYLASPAGVAHARDKLADLLWPSSGQEQARGSLRHALAALRKVLGPDAIESARDQIRLRKGVVIVDVDTMADVADGRVAPSLVDPWDNGTGEFLDGLTADGDALGEWLTFERTRSRAVVQTALTRVVEALSDGEMHAKAISVAERLVALDPLREGSHRVLMRALIASGEPSKAMDQFRRLEELLKAELGVAPSAKSSDLARVIRARPADAVDTAAPGPADGPAESSEIATRRIVLAVLPLQCLAPSDRLDGFASGFASDLIAGLSRVPDYSVIAWQSSGQMPGNVGDAARVGSELAADYALAGNIRIGDGRIRIGVQLIATASRAWVWADRFDLEAAEALAVQDRIVSGIMGSVDAGVRRAEREFARAKPIGNLDAWSLYHRGLWHMYRFTREDVTAAEALFKEALKKDAAAAAPLAGLAYACIVRTLWRFTDDPRGSIAEGLHHARQAVARDELDAHAHTVLGRLLVMSGQLQRGIEHLERAIELNPSHAHAYYGLGHALYVAGRPAEALSPLGTALRLSPKDPLASMFLTMTAFCQLMLDDLAEAEAAARRARNMLSKETWSRLALAATLQMRGDEAGARDAIAEAREVEPSLTISTFAPLIQHIPPKMRDRVLAALAASGLSLG